MDGTASGFAHIEFEQLDGAVAAFESASEEPIYLLNRNLRVDYAGPKTTPIAPNNKLYFSEFHGDEVDLRRAAQEFESSIISFYLCESYKHIMSRSLSQDAFSEGFRWPAHGLWLH